MNLPGVEVHAMADTELISVAQADVVRVIDGREYRFPPLRLAEIAQLAATWRARQRAELLASLDDAGVDPDARLKHLREFDHERILVGELWDDVTSPVGIGDVLLASMKRLDPQADAAAVDAIPVPVDELQALAVELVFGIKPSAVSAKAEEGATNADPTAAAN